MCFIIRHGVAHLVILAVGRLRQEGYEFKASLGYTVRPHLKNPQNMFHKLWAD
jgi:hypothetical protein